MRFTKILTLATAVLFASATASSASASSSAGVTVSAMTIAPSSLMLAVTQDPQPPKAEVKVNIDDQRGTVWYTDPLWLALGAIALLIVIVLAVMAARGGGDRGTTVVR